MAAPNTSYEPGLKPSRQRHWVIVFAVTLAIITYIDRVCISQAKSRIMADFGLSSEAQMGIIFTAFAWAYALFEIPSGWLGDWLGARKVLLRIVAWWSLFTAARGWTWNVASMTVTSFLFGAGEAGCFPNLTKAFTAWLPQHERVRAQGIMWMAARWGGAFTPILVVWILQYVSWRHAFQIFGAVGFVWAFFFARWFRDNPRNNPKVNQAELALLEGAEKHASGHKDVPWLKLVKSPSVWLLWVQYFCLSYAFWFYITWLPDYLQKFRRLDEHYAAQLASFPLLFGGFGCIFAGLIASRVARWIGVGASRRLLGFVGLLGAAILFFLHTRIDNAFWAMVAMGMASFCNDITMPGAWGACMDIGGKYAGSVSGSMNMMGNLGGGAAPLVMGVILDLTRKTPQDMGDWVLGLYLTAALYVVGAIAWLFIDPVTPLEPETPVAASRER